MTGHAGWRRWSVRKQLNLVMAAVAVPLVGLAAAIVVFELRLERRGAEQQVLQSARIVAHAVDRELASAESALRVLATSVNLRTGDWTGFHAQAEVARTSADAWILLFDPAARQVVNTRFPRGVPLARRANPERVDRVLATGRASVSGVYVGVLTQQPIVTVDVPVTIDGEPRYVLSQAYFLEYFDRLIREERLPDDWTVTIVDGDGQRIAGSAPGSGVPAAVVARARAAGGTGLVRATGEGSAAYHAFAPSQHADWLVSVAVPTAVLNAPTVRALLLTGVAGLLTLGVAAGLAGWTSARITRPLRGLAEAATALEAERPLPPRPPSTVEEVELVGRALEQAAAAIRSREARLRTLNEALARYTRELEDRVSERTRELSEINEQLEAFAYSVSHDLRAPLRALDGFARALLAHPAGTLDARGRDYAERIAAGAARMDRLIRDLLAYSHVTRAAVTLGPVDLERAVAAALRPLEGDAEAADADIRVADPLPRVRGSETLLAQALQNLVANALTFVPPGRRPVVRITAEAGERTVRLAVEDNGVGIPLEHHERIFEVFERVHGVDVYPGSGLGLAIARKAVERMHGRIGVQSGPSGSRFWIELPAVLAEDDGPGR